MVLMKHYKKGENRRVGDCMHSGCEYHGPRDTLWLCPTHSYRATRYLGWEEFAFPDDDARVRENGAWIGKYDPQAYIRPDDLKQIKRIQNWKKVKKYTETCYPPEGVHARRGLWSCDHIDHDWNRFGKRNKYVWIYYCRCCDLAKGRFKRNPGGWKSVSELADFIYDEFLTRKEEKPM